MVGSRAGAGGAWRGGTAAAAAAGSGRAAVGGAGRRRRGEGRLSGPGLLRKAEGPAGSLPASPGADSAARLAWACGWFPDRLGPDGGGGGGDDHVRHQQPRGCEEAAGEHAERPAGLVTRMQEEIPTCQGGMLQTASGAKTRASERASAPGSYQTRFCISPQPYA